MHVGLAVHRNAKHNPKNKVIFGQRPQTYEELEDRSNQIANLLNSYNWGKRGGSSSSSQQARDSRVNNRNIKSITNLCGFELSIRASRTNADI